MTTTIDRQERVRRAIEFRRPDRVPVVFWNRDQTEGDVMLYHLALGAPEERKADGRWKMADGTSQHATPDSQLPSPISQPFAGWDWSLNEWGYRLVKSGDGTMGHPVEPVYRELPRAIKVGRDSVEPSSAKRRLDGVSPHLDGAVAPCEDSRRLGASATGEALLVPALREEERMSAAPAFFEACGDRYRLASFDLSGFTVYTFLRGFENAMQDFLLEPEGFARMMNLIIDWECDLMRMVARHGFHGIHFADDWGTQSGMMVSPGLWRDLFKPRYARQCALAHELGLHTWYHCCGEFVAIMEDFHEIGVDVLNISQPNVNDMAEVGRRLRGRQCFMMPISYQTVSISGTPADIHAEARRLYDLLAVEQGGFVGYVEEYGVMGMSETNYRACGDAFRCLGVCS